MHVKLIFTTKKASTVSQWCGFLSVFNKEFLKRGVVQRINVTFTSKHATRQQRNNAAYFWNPGVCFYLQFVQEITDEYWAVNLHISSLYCTKSPRHILFIFKNNPSWKQSDLIWPTTDFHTWAIGVKDRQASSMSFMLFFSKATGHSCWWFDSDARQCKERPCAR